MKNSIKITQNKRNRFESTAPIIDCNNDIQIVNESLRQPKLNIDRTIFSGGSMEVNAARLSFNAFKRNNIKLFNETRDRNIEAIVNSKPTFNCLLNINDKRF